MGGPASALLSVDRGNSTLDCMLHPSGRRQRLAPDRPGELEAFLGADRPARCVAASVVPGGLEDAAAVLARLRVPLLLAGRELPCPLLLDYDDPATLGVDRWLGALAAHARFGRSVVVDCGSATTVNLVSQEGVFRGGCIAPGLASLADAAGRATPHLPGPPLDWRGPLPARGTAAAVAAGILLGYCGLVERLVAEIIAVAGGPVTVVLTGGNAEIYLRHGRLRPVHVADLVHQGLRLLAETAP